MCHHDVIGQIESCTIRSEVRIIESSMCTTSTKVRQINYISRSDIAIRVDQIVVAGAVRRPPTEFGADRTHLHHGGHLHKQTSKYLYYCNWECYPLFPHLSLMENWRYLANAKNVLLMQSAQSEGVRPESVWTERLNGRRKVGNKNNFTLRLQTWWSPAASPRSPPHSRPPHWGLRPPPKA